MSKDGTMVAVPHSPQSPCDSSAINGASDTESNSESGPEVNASPFECSARFLLQAHISLSSGPPLSGRHFPEPNVQRLFSVGLESESRLGEMGLASM